MTLDNFRIVKLDEFNITFDEYKEVKSKKDNSTSMEWVRVGGYYGSLDACLNGLKKYIINSYTNLESVEEVINKINELNGAIVSCKLEVEEND